MNRKQACSIILPILEKHQICSLNNGEMTILAYGLNVASDEKYFYTEFMKIFNQDYDKRKLRIKYLKKLTKEYESVLQSNIFEEYVVVSGRRYEIDESHREIFKRYFNLDLKKTLKQLKELSDIESEVDKNTYKMTLSASRPTGSKNGGAVIMCKVFQDNKIKIRKSCEIISEILIDARITQNTQEKETNALYDKLKRFNFDSISLIR